MTDPAERILIRMRQLQAQGRPPELTAGDAAVTLGTNEDAAREVLTGLVRIGALRPARRINPKLPGVWRLRER